MVAVRKSTKTKTVAKSTARPASKKSATPTRTTTKRATTSTKVTPKRATTTRTTTAKPATRTRKAVTPTPTRTAKAANRGTTATKTRSTATTKKATTTRKVKEVAKPTAAPKTGPNRVVDDTTGFAIGTDSHLIAMELLKGGVDRAEIIERCAKKLPPTSNRGTPKPVANMVASVLGKMKDQGFTIESSWVLTPPTRASKAKATRERNKRLGK